MSTDEPATDDGPGVEPAARARVDLEWPALLDALAARCMSESGVERMRSLEPSDTLAEARERMQRTAEALLAAEFGEPVPARAVPRLEGVLGHVRRSGVATAEDLRDVAAVLTAARLLRPYERARRAEQAALARALWTEPSLDGLLDELQHAIDEDGRIRDSASLELEQARHKLKTLRRRLLDKLDQLTARYADVLRDRQYVERDGRFTLPVRSDAHRPVAGIVLGSSASGATLYVEPREVTELGNRLKMADGEVEREQARVLAELSGRVRRQLPELTAAYEACITADVLAALTGWAGASQSIALLPAEEGCLELRDVRHPLLVLQGVTVVANDVTVRSGTALVISGPNAGGKTVTLKCLGLVALMARCGVPLPVADGSQIGWYDRVLTDFGDEQSLERSLSTFSAEVANLTEILRLAGPRCLVLLDEVAASTDPEEGSALAAAVLETLVEGGAAVVATTHYERLKELATANERFVNASVGFDFDRMVPTFGLTVGLPGSSSALAVAAQHGLPRSVVARAKELLSQPTVDRQQLLEQLERERRSLAAARAEAVQDASCVRQLRSELEQERGVVRRKERRRLAREAADLTQAIQQARTKLHELDARLRSGDAREALRDGERLVDEAARTVAVGSPLQTAVRQASGPTDDGPISPRQLTVGAPVYVPKLGTVATVEEPPDRGQVLVRAGGLTARVRVDQLRRSTAGSHRAQPVRAPQRLPPRSSARTDSKFDFEAPIRTTINTCDLRGQRVDEALTEVDAFVDRCLQHNEPVGFVLHGHGTGALKQAVRQHLAASSLIAHCRPAELREGGDAFTVFWLRS